MSAGSITHCAILGGTMSQLPKFFPKDLIKKDTKYAEIESNQGLLKLGATADLIEVCTRLKLYYEQLLDLTIVDRLHYGQSPWPTQTTSAQGYNRAAAAHWEELLDSAFVKGRFVWVAVLRSYAQHHTLIVQAPVPESLDLPSVMSLWPSANWYEREAYDLFGVVFLDHPDLRRILSDYGFVGHPLRKDYPMMGYDDIRYDGSRGQCVFEPHGQQQRMSIPKVIRPMHETGGNND